MLIGVQSKCKRMYYTEQWILSVYLCTYMYAHYSKLLVLQEQNNFQSYNANYIHFKCWLMSTNYFYSFLLESTFFSKFIYCTQS